MRDVVLRQYAVSLDGFSCADDSEFQRYVFGVEDPELDRQIVESLQGASTHIMGRNTFLDMSAYWPTATGPIADAMNSIPKVVFSKSLDHTDWADSQIARGDTVEEIERLKAMPGGEIIAHGGFRFTQSLVQKDLVDEFRLYIFPVALGHGSSIFATVDQFTKLRLVSSVEYSSGVVLQTLRRSNKRRED